MPHMKRLLEIAMNAPVRCLDKHCGHVSGVIFDPVTRQLTHFVLAVDGLLHDEYLVPVDLIVNSPGDTVLLSCRSHDLADLQPFHETRFVQVDPADYPHLPGVMAGASYEWPMAMTGEGYALAVESESVPPHELALHRGAIVQAADGPLGHVAEFLLDAETKTITHLVLRCGHFWHRHNVVIPIAAVERVSDDIIYLKLRNKEVNELPAISTNHT